MSEFLNRFLQQQKQSLQAPVTKIGRLGDLFVQRGLLSPEQVEQITELQQQQKMRFGDAALSLGLLTQAQIDAAVGEQFGYASADLLNGKASDELHYLHQPFSDEAEEIRRLRSELLLRFGAQKKIRVALVSPAHGEGKSYMAASLGIALSQVGKRCLIIDANLREGGLHDYFGLGKPDGLSSVLAGRIDCEKAITQLTTNLYILPAGPTPPNPLEILRAPRIQLLLESLLPFYDAFIVDTYSASLAADAQMVAHQVGTALLMARQDQTTLESLRQTQHDMQAAGVEVLGSIFNQWGASLPYRKQLKNWLNRFKRN